MSLADLPVSLKSIKPYLERGDQIAAKDKVVAYHCKLYALQEAMALRAKIPKQDMGFVLQLMDVLETEKSALGESEDAQIVVENFGQDLFQKADDLDRSGQSDLRTGKAFLAAANVMEACKQFGELPADLAEKIKYAKWRFVEIAKAMKEGRPPVPPRGMDDGAGGADDGAPTDLTAVPPAALEPPPDASMMMPPAAPPPPSDVPDYMGLPPAQPPQPSSYPPAPVGYPSAPAYPSYPSAPAMPAAPPPQAMAMPNAMPGAPPAMPGAPMMPGAPANTFKPGRPAIMEAINLCKSAIAALQFQDSDTAVHHLNQALAGLSHPPMPRTTSQ